jgi:outer membrane lipoprotein-sorting protein
MKLVFFIAFLLGLQIAHSAELSTREADALERRFFAAQAGTATLEANFLQTISAPGLQKPVSSAGRMFFRSPEALRIEYTDPAGDWMQLGGGNYTVVRSNRQPVSRPEDHPSARVLAALREILRGRQPAEEMRRSISREGEVYRVTLEPLRESANQPARIDIEAAVEGLELRSLLVALPRGASMRFDFSGWRRNHPLPANAFGLE